MNRISALQSNPGKSMMNPSGDLLSSSGVSKMSKGIGKKLVQIESQESRELNSRRMKPKQSENKERKESQRTLIEFETGI